MSVLRDDFEVLETKVQVTSASLRFCNAGGVNGKSFPFESWIVPDKSINACLYLGA